MVQSVYSEVYSILNMLGDEYINKLPTKLLEFIEREKANLYNPVYNLDKSIEEQGISEDALAMITFFNLKYWCAPEEKEELLEVLRENEKRYNMLSVVEKTFNNNEEKKIENIDEKDMKKEIMPIKVKEGFWNKIFNRIKSMFIN